MPSPALLSVLRCFLLSPPGRASLLSCESCYAARASCPCTPYSSTCFAAAAHQPADPLSRAQLDIGLHFISVFVCGHDGPLDICAASGIDATIALYSSVLWLHRPDAVLLDRPPQHSSYPALGHYSAGMPPLVSRELFSNGLKRPALCHVVWRAQCGCLDVRLNSAPAPPPPGTGYSACAKPQIHSLHGQNSDYHES